MNSLETLFSSTSEGCIFLSPATPFIRATKRKLGGGGGNVNTKKTPFFRVFVIQSLSNTSPLQATNLDIPPHRDTGTDRRLPEINFTENFPFSKGLLRRSAVVNWR